MSTDRKELVRGLKYELIALPLLALGPILITLGLKSIKQDMSPIWLIVGIIICICAIMFGLIGIRIILNALFDKN